METIMREVKFIFLNFLILLSHKVETSSLCYAALFKDFKEEIIKGKMSRKKDPLFRNADRFISAYFSCEKY
jgi:hypothetical protein